MNSAPCSDSVKRYLHIVLLLVVACSCRGPRMIPRDKLADIYYDMFMADQQIRENQSLRSRADTMLVYEAVFNKYGYDTDDYLYTVENNLKDPERFSKVLRDVGDRLQEEADRLNREVSLLDWKDKFLGMRRPALDSILAPFSGDSLYVGLARVARDSTSSAWFRLVGVQEDTLMIPVDSLPPKKDTLSHE